MNLFEEGYYDAINDMEITDVFQNFEDKYGSDNTTELTTFKDMKQKDGYPSNDLNKYKTNILKAVHDRDKNIGIENKIFSKMNYLKEGRFDENMYEEMFLEGYYDALEELNEASRSDIAVGGTLAAGAAAGLIAAGVHNHKLNNDLNYRKKYMDKKRAKQDARNRKAYEKYKNKGGKLSYKKWLNQANREYEKYQIDGGKMKQEDYEKAKREEAKRRAQAAEEARKRNEEQAERELQRRERIARLERMQAATSRDRAAAEREHVAANRMRNNNSNDNRTRSNYYNNNNNR